MSELQALIFDVDGTLAETERDGHRVAFNRAFTEAGLDWNWSVELYGTLLAVAGGKERIHFYINRYHPNLKGFVGTQEAIADLHAAKTKHYQNLLASGAIPLRPGVKRLLLEARERGARLAIATTSALPNAIALLEQTLDPSWFEIIAAGDVIPAKKPAPDIYHYVLEKMRLTPQDCLVFEDSQHGLQAASQADLKTIVTINEYTREQDFSEAILVLNHLGEPDRPFTILAGEALEASYFDLRLASRLHGKYTRST